MRVLVFNAGSASLKFDLVNIREDASGPSSGRKLVSAIIEGIGGDSPSLSLLNGKDVAEKSSFAAKDYAHAASAAIQWLRENESKGDFRFDLIGHRVVHGADRFDGPAAIDNHVISSIKELDKLAPLHNQAAVEVIESTRKVLGDGQRMIAAFDTSFHRSLPPAAYTYALPFDLIQKHGIRRYGFHGLSHRYLALRYCELTGSAIDSVRLMTTHLESGASICAIRDGQPVETSMGFTPLEGLVMGKRSGDLDPAIVTFLAREEKCSLDEVEKILNKQSGLLGLSGISHDTRELTDKVDTNERVRLALDVFCHRLRKYIGAYLAVLNGADALVFGGGIGEDSPSIREAICRDCNFLGIALDEGANRQAINQERLISRPDSRVAVWVIPTEEALMLAWEAAEIQ